MRLYAPDRAMPHANRWPACASKFAAVNAPYECPPIAMDSGVAMPLSTSWSTAADAAATSCSMYVSLGSVSAPSASGPAIMGMVGPARTAIPSVTSSVGLLRGTLLNRNGESRICPAASFVL